MSGIKKITDEVKSAVAKSVEPMKQLTTQAKDMASKSASSVSQMKSQMKSYSNSIQETAKQQEYLKTKIEDLKYLLSQADMGFEVGDTLKIEADIEKLENRLKKLQNQGKNTGKETSSAFDKIKAKVKTAGTQIAGLGSKFKNALSGSKNLGKSFTSTFNNGIKSIKKFALGLLSVRTAFSVVSKAMQSYLSYDTQLSDSIQNCWNVLGSLLAPVLEVVVSLFSKAVRYVNAFVQALTGINLVARANSKAIDSQAKSTKKLSDTQSSLDEFHTVNTDSGSSGGNNNNLITTENVDLSWIDKIKEKLSSINFEPLLASLNNLWDSMKFLKSGIVDLAKDFWNNFLLPLSTYVIENTLPDFFNATAEAIKQIDFGKIGSSLNELYNSLLPFTKSIFDGLLWFYEEILIPISLWVINDVIPSFLDILSGALNVLNQAITDIQPIFEWLWENALKPLAEFTGGIIVDVLNGIGDALNWIAGNEVAMAILEGIAIAIGLVATAIGIYNVVMAVCNVVTSIFSGIMAVLTSPITLVVLAIGALIAVIILCVKHWETIKETAIAVWEKIKSVMSTVAKWFDDKVIKPLANLFSGIWNTLKNGAQNAWNGIKNIFSSVATFFKNIFSNAWNGVKNVFSSGGKIFSGIKDGIFNAFKSVVNTLIAGINKVVSIPFNAINTALKTVRDISFLGIEPFKGLIKLINVPQIPSLATGAVLDSETIVRVAEYSNAKSNPEIVSPKDMMKETMKEALEESNHNNSKQQVDVNITGKLTAEGDDLVYVYDKNKKDKGYDGGKNPSFAY